ncbi:acyl-ACP--UDP-N-acetylglucosamine O-acyltransferase [Rubellicoccus peritrichatus]|uniref:Acyl-ACP--UDP-N-acetylglucosamine O-acyltransferase n=1 Tax=Rubellicoccus peritrichatus TaxID=3080537 RepID=A0AAQ3L6U6_9BACT|nr:acyl-ACP--UDP-N-acetylglucosamine O-acyltransferase [Puniceicoccus sp. CR14]WOO40136.1 acyl-ACP--UDP-N-acetylglucosamine O-acyltransferase [Puniceicoccus sp. CR14]
MAKIHPTAIIEDGAQIADNVTIGAYAYIGAEVSIGAGTMVEHHATVDGFTEMGDDNQVFPYAFIGGKTHDLKYTGGKPGLKIGSRNVFREYSTVHLATNDAEFTILGDDNVILAYSHVAHDCIIGNHLVMSSHAALGGHVLVGNHCNIGWGVGLHQFCRIGDHAMAGACSKVVQDVPPYMIADGNPAEVRTINKVGLERNGFSSEDIELVRSIYKTLYREGLNRTQAREKLSENPKATDPTLKRVIDFLEQGGKRGIT